MASSSILYPYLGSRSGTRCVKVRISGRFALLRSASARFFGSPASSHHSCSSFAIRGNLPSITILLPLISVVVPMRLEVMSLKPKILRRTEGCGFLSCFVGCTQSLQAAASDDLNDLSKKSVLFIQLPGTLSDIVCTAFGCDGVSDFD